MGTQSWINWRTQGRKLLGVLAAVVLWTVPSPSWAQQEEIIESGTVEFQTYCTLCHGSGARGDGPLASELKTEPTDLTQISKNNEGTFPFWRVYRVVEGTDPTIRMHGREMPIWGDQFQWEGRGVGTDAVLARVRGRIFSLVYYLESIQEE